MSLFQNDILANQTVLSNQNHHVILCDKANKYTSQPIMAPFSGMVVEKQGVKPICGIKCGDFTFYWVNRSIVNKKSLKSVSKGDIIGSTYMLGDIINKDLTQGVEVWLEKNGETVDIIPYLLRRDKTEIKVTKTRKKKVTEDTEE